MPYAHEFELYHRKEDSPAHMDVFHAHDYYEFYIYLSGNIDIAVEEKLYTPKPYDLFIFPPGVMHRWAAKPNVGRYERVFLYIRCDCFESMSTPDFPMLHMVEQARSQHAYSFRPGVQSVSALVGLWDEIICSSGLSDPADRLLNRCRVNMLLASICRLITPKTEEKQTIPTRTRDIITYINEHLTEPLTLDALAEHFFVSKYYLLHAFKDYANLSVHQYIISKRIIYAQNLMREGMPPGAAARACGFNDYAGFYRAFVKQTGFTPQAYYQGGLPGKKADDH